MQEAESLDPKAQSQKAPDWQAHQSPNRQSTIDNLLDLSAAEVFVDLRAGERMLRHIFCQPTAEDWLEYERGMNPRLVTSGEEMEAKLSTAQAANLFWLKRILRVEGYPQITQIPPIRSEPSVKSADWKGLIPLQHRIAAIGGLDRVQKAEDQWLLDDSETVAIILEARWNEVFFPRLVHRFRRPTVEHELRFEEAVNRWARRTERLGGQRRPTAPVVVSHSLPSLPTLIALYDELIGDVEGYQFGEWASKAMPVPHKSAAIRALFAREAVELPAFRPEKKDTAESQTIANDL